MDTAETGFSSLNGTWKPAWQCEPGISSDDESTEFGTYSFLTPMAFSGFRRTPVQQGSGFRKRSGYQGQQSVQQRFRRQITNDRQTSRPAVTGRDVYWCSSGPRMETRKMGGNQLDLPVVAPTDAPPEDKKLILNQMDF